MDWLIHQFLPFIILITVLVFVHEWGHFWVARRCGVRVTQFAIGFGPELFGWTDKHQTRWRFCIIPMGGYIKMLGDGDASSTTHIAVPEEEKKFTLESKTPLQRIAVAGAGPLANFIFAWFVLVALMSSKGEPILEAVVGNIQSGSVASQSDIQKGDRITHIGTAKITSFHDIRHELANHAGKDVSITLIRNGETLSKNIALYSKDPVTGEIVQQKKLGVMSPEPTYVHRSIFESIGKGFTIIGQLCADMLNGLFMMIAGGRGSEMGGLISIGDMASQSVHHGITSIAWFLVVLSVNLGLLNLLPIPVLDGGHILLNTLELIRKKPLNDRAQGILFRVGFIFLLGVMVYANWNDLARYGVIKFVSQLWRP